jgi:hypothetical protein
MASRGSLVAQGLCNNAATLSSLEKLKHLGLILCNHWLWLVLGDSVVLSNNVLLIEQIPNRIHINFLYWDLNLKWIFQALFSLCLILPYTLKDLIDCSRNDTLVWRRSLFWHLSTHGISLSTTGLAIGKDSHVVAIKEALYQMAHLAVHLILSRLLAEDTVKVEDIWGTWLFQFNRELGGVQGDYGFLNLLKGFLSPSIGLEVLTQDWPHSDEDPNVPLVLQVLV